jgi:hypothetical protein
LKTGEYTLAIADTANIRVGLPSKEVSGFVLMYPNPATKSVKLEFPTFGNNTDLAIFSQTGAKVLEIKNIHSGENINISKLPSGTYTVRLTADGDAFFVDKLIVK